MHQRLFALLTITVMVTSLSSCNGVDDIEIGDPMIQYLDPELWGPTRQMVWLDGDTNDVWISGLDPNTGSLIPTDGRGIQSPRKAVQIFNEDNGLGAFNGPEFGFNQQGLFIYQTVRDGNGVNQVGRFGPLSSANPSFRQLTTGGVFSRSGTLPSQTGSFPIGAQLTLLLTFNEQIVWRFDNEATADRFIPVNDIGLKGPRWIDGELSVATNVLDGSFTQQAAIFDLLNRETTILTNDEGDKSDVFIFDAPELGTRAMMCLTGERGRQLAVYAEDTPFWRRVATVEAPQFLFGGGPEARIFLPEPFTFNGQSYFVFVVGSANPDELQVLGPSQIFVASLQDATPVAASGNFPAGRIDPEVVVLDGNAFLYYYTVVEAEESSPFNERQLRVVRNFIPTPGQTTVGSLEDRALKSVRRTFSILTGEETE